MSPESLLRWRQDDGSLSLPEDFICQVEVARVMVPLVMNLPALQLQQNNLMSSLKQSLERFQVGCSQLVLEITETARINEFASLFQMLRDLGIVIALDDLGMCYFSLYCLDHLWHMPIDMVKIDPSFIATLHEDAMILGAVSAITECLTCQLSLKE